MDRLKIKEWRKARRIKQEELARIIGRSVQALSAIERGKSVPRDATLQALVKAFGLSEIADLYLSPEEWCRSQEAEDFRRTARIINRVAVVAEDDFEALPRLLSALREIVGRSRTT